MKKILMGLVALSTMSFAAQPVINGTVGDANTGEGKNVWEGVTTHGAIEVTGTFTSTVKPTRYVIFASEDGSWGPTAEASLTLPPFTISTVDGESNFESIPRKVYVKKVNDGKTGVEEVVGNVTFGLELDASISGLNAVEITSGAAEIKTVFTAYLSKSQIDGLIKKLNDANLGLGTFSVDTWGSINNGSQYIFPSALISLQSTQNGIFTISTTLPEKSAILTDPRVWTIVNEYFATPVSNTFKIKARVQ